MCETKRCRGSLRGRMTACQRACGRPLRDWKPSRVLDVSVHDGREPQGVGLGLSGVGGLCDLVVTVWWEGGDLGNETYLCNGIGE